MDKSASQLKDVQKAIQQNIDSIRSLLDQADALNAVINEVTDDTLKGRLSDSLAELYKSIDTLVTNTNSLFDELVEYAQENYHPAVS